MGVDLRYNELKVGVFGIEVTELQIGGLEIGTAKVEEIRASLDWSELAAGELHFRSIALTGAGINLDDVFWAETCQELSFCGKDGLSRQPSRSSTSTADGIRRAQLPTFREADNMLAGLADTWIITDMRVDVASGEWASITAHHLIAQSRGDEIAIEGDGLLSSPYAVDNSEFKFSGQLGGSGALELAVGR